MAAQNNLHIPDDLLSAVSEAASADGKTTDELAAEALRRYLAHRNLEELSQYGQEQSSRLGYTEAGVPAWTQNPGVKIVAARVRVTLDTNVYVSAFQFGGMRL